MMKSHLYANHQPSADTILGGLGSPNYRKVLSQGSRFFNVDRWVMVRFQYAMQTWACATRNKGRHPTERDIAEWVDAANAPGMDMGHASKKPDSPFTPSKPFIQVAATPTDLSPRTFLAIVGGVYHESWHTLYSRRTNLREKDALANVMSRWGQVPDWSVYMDFMVGMSNIVEDIRIERIGNQQYPGTYVKMCDLQDFIVDQESESYMKAGKAMPALSVAACAFRDIGLGYKTEKGDDAMRRYAKDNIEALELVTKGALAPLVSRAINLSKADDTECLWLAMDVIIELHKASIQPPPPPPPNPEPQPKGKGKGKEGESESKPEGKGGGSKGEVDSDSDGGSDGEDDGEGEGDSDSEGKPKGKGGSEGEKDAKGKSASDKGKSQSDAKKGGDSKSKGGDSEGGDSKSKSEEGGDSEGDSEGNGSNGGSDGEDDGEGGDTPSQQQEDPGTGGSGPVGGTPSKKGTAEVAAQILKDAEEGVQTVQGWAAALEQVLKDLVILPTRSSAPWRPYSTDNDTEVLRTPTDPQAANAAVARSLTETRKVTAYMQTRLRQMIREAEMVGTDHGVRKGRMLSDRFMINSAIALRSGTAPRRAYKQSDEEIDVSLAAAMVLDESGSMSGKERLTMQGLIALTATLDRLGAATQVIGFRDGPGYTPSGCEAYSQWDDEYHRHGSIIYDVYKTFGERFTNSAVKARFGDMVISGSTPMSDGIAHAMAALNKRPEGHRILFVFTDGSPNREHAPVVKWQIEQCQKAGIHLVGVGLGRSSAYVTTLFPDHVFAISLDKLAPMLISKLNELLNFRHNQQGGRAKRGKQAQVRG